MSDVKHWTKAANLMACGAPWNGLFLADEVTCIPCLTAMATTSSMAKYRLAQLQSQPAAPIARVPVADAAGVLRMDGLADVRTLLTRLSDFLANLPSGSLDRARNLECMTLRREIANAIVPADKKHK